MQLALQKISAVLAAATVFASMLFFAFPQSVQAAIQVNGVEVEPGYDYERFKGKGITLNVYNWGEYISVGTDGESMDVNAEFTALTGIKVNYTTFDTNESLYSKLKSGGADYDVIFPSDYMIGKMIREDMLAPVNFENVPNFRMIGEQYKYQDYDPENKFSVPYTWGYVGIIYNTTMVDEDVESWAILWDEAYTDNILMFDNSRDSFAIAALKEGLPFNPESKQDIDASAATLARQRPIVQAYVMDQIFDKMEGGEAALAPYYAGDAITMMEENEDLAFAVPKEGTNYFVDAMCIPKTSAQKEAAEMYINFLCETEVAAANALYIGYSTPQIEAQAILPEEIRNNPVAYPPPELLENTWTFSALSEELNNHMDKAWNDMRAGTETGSGWTIPIFLLLGVIISIVVAWRRKLKKHRNEY